MKLLNVTLLSLFFFQLSFSQTLKYADGTSQNMSNIFVNVNSNQNSNIKGSKYLNEDFISTKISSMPDQIFGVRYNIYDDQMEFQGADNTVYALNKSDDSIVITFTATNESYNIFNYIDEDGRQKKGYFIKLNNEGENLILKKHRIVFYEGQASKTGYDAPKPAMYKNVNDIRQHSVTEKLGVLQKFYYKPDDTSLIVHFAGSKSNQRTDLFNNLKQEWSI